MFTIPRYVGLHPRNVRYKFVVVFLFQERTTCSGLDGAVDALLRAAGTLRYIHENFTNAPSVDLATDTLLVLPALMTVSLQFLFLNVHHSSWISVLVEALDLCKLACCVCVSIYSLTA